jgi:hypothetical protein
MSSLTKKLIYGCTLCLLITQPGAQTRSGYEPTAGVHAATQGRNLALSPGEEVVEGRMPFERKIKFQITVEDETLYLALRRWSTETGHQLIWDAGKDFAARATTYKEDNIISAVDRVMKDTQNSSYPLHACAYANKVIRVLHISQVCQRTLP